MLAVVGDRGSWSFRVISPDEGAKLSRSQGIEEDAERVGEVVVCLEDLFRSETREILVLKRDVFFLLSVMDMESLWLLSICFRERGGEASVGFSNNSSAEKAESVSQLDHNWDERVWSSWCYVLI